jgi:uncharacterized protein involved in type VI secretion and phage assembly
MNAMQPPGPTRYYGKYRGTVANNIDPNNRGRLQVNVPAVYGTNTLNWALPCVPYAGDGVGFLFLPPIGANIWVEFEGGDITFPIWSGCFWGDGQGLQALPQTMILKTPAGILTFDQLNPDAAITLEIENGPKITLSAQGITLDNGLRATVEMAGPSVKINGDALEVM